MKQPAGLQCGAATPQATRHKLWRHLQPAVSQPLVASHRRSMRRHASQASAVQLHTRGEEAAVQQPPEPGGGASAKASTVAPFLEARGVTAEFLPTAQAALRRAADVKSIICAVNGRPIVVVLLEDGIIDFKRAAKALGVRRNRVRLARPHEVASTGFEIGAVPPLGHRSPLQTLVDQKVLEHNRVRAGSGDPDQLMILETWALVNMTQAAVADVRKALPSDAQPAPAADAQPAPPPPRAGAEAQGGVLPLPWAPGASIASLSARIIGRRRLGNCLAFLDLGPLDTPVYPREQASAVRWLWADPDSQRPARLQLVVGATLERRLGPVALAALLDKMTVGTAVSIIGRPQAPRRAAAAENGAASLADSADPAERPAVDLEAVCEDVRLLQPPTPASPPRPAAAAGGLRRPQRPPPEQVAEAEAAPRQPASPVYAVPEESVEVVSSIEGLRAARAHIFEGPPEAVDGGGDAFRVVGLDCEWEPAHKHAHSPVTLLQLATRRRAFLLDLKAFCTPAPLGWSNRDAPLPQPNHRELAVSDFLAELFGAAHIVKAGFELHGDVKMLCRSFPHLPCFREPAGEAAGGALPVVSYADLKRVALTAMPATAGLTRFIGLARLVALVMGRTLDKSQQASSWGSRPLTREQIAYAGADAHVLTGLLDDVLSRIAPPGVPLAAVPEELLGSLDVAQAAHEARLWHKVHSGGEQVEDPGGGPEPGGPEAGGAAPPPLQRPCAAAQLKGRPRHRERTPRMATATGEHGVNLAALEEFLGLCLPKSGRTVVVQVAAADASGRVPTAVPRYARGGGIVVWKTATMLFVNIDREAGSFQYPNTFPEGGREVVWFPAPGQTERHPVLRRMLGLPPLLRPGAAAAEASEAAPQQPWEEPHAVLLFCRLRGVRWRPFLYCGRLHRPRVDWAAGSNGVLVWQLQDYDRLADKPAFRELVEAANEKKQTLTFSLTEPGPMVAAAQQT